MNTKYYKVQTGHMLFDTEIIESEHMLWFMTITLILKNVGGFQLIEKHEIFYWLDRTYVL